MNSENWIKIEAIYDAAINISASQRQQFVKDKSQGEQNLYQQVMKMLESENSQDFMSEFPGKVNTNNIELDIPKQLGHFKILKKIATGGMGRVYLAQSNRADVTIKVALKTIRIELINDELKRKFQNEKNILSKLHHKNIASLIDAGVTENQIPYIATEWVNGKNIKNYCIDKNLSIKRRLKLFLQICDAMTFAHNKLIIHRDLKPDNILVNNHQQAKLLDFGIAKIIDENHYENTQTQIFTPDYAAPEQLNGERCTAATDIYSLGVILFEMLTNSKRFNLAGLAIAEKIKAIAIPKLTDLSDVYPEHKLNYSVTNLKGPLYTIINKAMHVDPSRRYDSVSSMVADIESYLDNRPIKAMNDSIFYKTKMLLKRNKLSSAFFTLAFIAILVGWYFTHEQVKISQKQVHRLEVLLGFFKNMSASVSPAEGGSTETTVRQMLKTGMEKFDINDIDDDYIKAELSAQIGHIYMQIDEKDKGLEYLNYAVEYYKTHNAGNEKNAQLYMEYSNLVAESYLADQNFKKTQEYLNTMLQQVESNKLNTKGICDSYLLLAEATFYQDQEKSMNYIEKAEKIAEKNNYFEIIGIANFYKHALFYASLTPGESLKHLDKAQINLEKFYKGKSNPNLVSVMTSKAAVLGHMGNFVAAEKGFAKASELTIAFYGRDKYIVVTNRANNIYMLGHFAESLRYLELAEKLFAESKHDKNINYYGILLNKSATLIEFSRFEEAKNDLQQTLNFFMKTLPNGHRIIKIVQNRLADLYVKSNNTQMINSSKKLLEKFLLTSKSGKKLNDKLLISTLTNLANMNLILKNNDAAFNAFSQVLTLMEKNVGIHKNSWQYQQIKTGLALSIIKTGDREHIQSFQKSKKQLLVMTKPNNWYNTFYSYGNIP